MDDLPQTKPSNIYTPQYCEENVYLLAKQLLETSSHLKTFAVFISNAVQTVILSEQRAALSHNQPVVWDYHVILLSIDRESQILAWDFDSTLPFPCKFDYYMDCTFPDFILAQIRESRHELSPLFHIIPSAEFLDFFASDRSHMIDPVRSSFLSSQVFLAPPPVYAPLVGRYATMTGSTHNLFTHFLNFSDDSQPKFGMVCTLEQMLALAWIHPIARQDEQSP